MKIMLVSNNGICFEQEKKEKKNRKEKKERKKKNQKEERNTERKTKRKKERAAKKRTHPLSEASPTAVGIINCTTFNSLQS